MSCHMSFALRFVVMRKLAICAQSWGTMPIILIGGLLSPACAQEVPNGKEVQFKEFQSALWQVESVPTAAIPDENGRRIVREGEWSLHPPKGEEKRQCIQYKEESKFCSTRWLAKLWERDDIGVAWGRPDSRKERISALIFLDQKRQAGMPVSRVEVKGPSIVAASRRNKDGGCRIYGKEGTLEYSHAMPFSRHHADGYGRLVAVMGLQSLAVYDRKAKRIIFSKHFDSPYDDGRLMQLRFGGFSPDASQLATMWVQAANPKFGHKRMIRRLDVVDFQEGRTTATTDDIEIDPFESGALVGRNRFKLTTSGRIRTYEIHSK